MRPLFLVPLVILCSSACGHDTNSRADATAGPSSEDATAPDASGGSDASLDGARASDAASSADASLRRDASVDAAGRDARPEARPRDSSVPADTGPADGSTPSDAREGEQDFQLTFEEVTLPDELTTQLLGHRFLPDTNELLLWTQKGTVGHLAWDGQSVSLLGSFDIAPGYTGGDCGIQLAVDPDFSENHYVYFTLCDDALFSGIYRYELDTADYAGIAATKTLILNEGSDQAPAPIHNIGAIGFDGDGNLWALFGDKAVESHGQDLSTNLGTLIRVRPNDGPTGGYLPVDHNPLVNDPEASKDIFAYGFRSPYTGLRDHHGFYWVGDVGRNDWEEVNLVTSAGQNFGWSLFEGPCDPDTIEGCESYIDPLFAWPHDFDHDFFREDPEPNPTIVRAAFVGTEYEPNPGDPYAGELDHHVLFGELCAGFVRAAAVDATGAVLSNRHVGHIEGAISWDQAPDGLLTVATYGACEAPRGDETPPKGAFYRALPSWGGASD